MAEIPSEMRRRFSEVTEEKNVMLHDKLEHKNKYDFYVLKALYDSAFVINSLAPLHSPVIFCCGMI